MLNFFKRFYLHFVGTVVRCCGRGHEHESSVGGRSVTVLVSTLVAVLIAAMYSLTVQATGETQDAEKTQHSTATLEIAVAKLSREPVLFFLKSKSRSLSETLSTDAVHARITSRMSQFDPPLQILPVGTTLEMVNRDPVLHNTHVFNGSRTVFNVATPNADISVQRTLSRPGLFGVRCDLHPSMNAWIAVVSDANYVVIDSPGVYRIENIKPGHYEVHIQRPERQDEIMQMNLGADEERKIQLPP